MTPTSDASASTHHFKSLNFTGLNPGPKIIITGAVHGNETCGTQAITRVLDDIEQRRLRIVAGSVTFVPITNPLAYARRDRVGDRNLNRNLYPVDSPADFEDHVANWLCPLLASHEALLDLHSTRAQNPAFAMLGPENNSGALQPFKHYEKERALAKRLGVHRFVDGWLSTYAKGVERRVKSLGVGGDRSNQLTTDPRYGVGTTEYMRSVGGYAITLECGAHDDPSSPEVGYRAILNTLAFLGISDSAPPAPVEKYEALRMMEVHDKNHVGDTFSRAWASFDPLKKGDVIGTRHDGTQLLAEDDGCILFPDAKAEPG
ncbi:MAG: succinylglutamate desuccinylase/aspartoacylase family protein, partial [Usitatibacteraceae bacterium]